MSLGLARWPCARPRIPGDHFCSALRKEPRDSCALGKHSSRSHTPAQESTSSKPADFLSYDQSPAAPMAPVGLGSWRWWSLLLLGAPNSVPPAEEHTKEPIEPPHTGPRVQGEGRSQNPLYL